jgi:methylenetetrahydrofolate dehydrogenase (NADP+) / methenyltetrahydrofolate cyclohydrolase
MVDKIIDGKAIADMLRAQIKENVKTLGIQPGLAVVLVGHNPASKVYVDRKSAACHDVGFYSQKHELPENTSEDELLTLITMLNKNQRIHGILVQLPLPPHINEKKVTAAVIPSKDVDGFHPVNVGALNSGGGGFVSCTPKGIIYLLDNRGVSIEGKHAVIVGRSTIVGRPVATLLLNRHATVTLCHSKTRNLAEHTRIADILIVAAGKPKIITADMVKEGVVIIDVGVNRVNGMLVGDVDFENVKEKSAAITPVPKGVGPMTIAMLLQNTLEAAKIAQKSQTMPKRVSL